MGKIKTLKNNELVGGIDNTSIYPVTSTSAVFNSSNKNLDTLLADKLDKGVFEGTADNLNDSIVENALDLGNIKDNSAETILSDASSSDKWIDENGNIIAAIGSRNSKNGVHAAAFFDKDGNEVKNQDLTVYVEKEAGKGLTSNDFSNAYKEKVDLALQSDSETEVAISDASDSDVWIDKNGNVCTRVGSDGIESINMRKRGMEVSIGRKWLNGLVTKEGRVIEPDNVTVQQGGSVVNCSGKFGKAYKILANLQQEIVVRFDFGSKVNFSSSFAFWAKIPNEIWYANLEFSDASSITPVSQINDYFIPGCPSNFRLYKIIRDAAKNNVGRYCYIRLSPRAYSDTNISIVFDFFIQDQSIKPCVLINYDGIYQSTQDTGVYDYLFDNNLPFTVFSSSHYDNYQLGGIYKAIMDKMFSFGCEIGGYGAQPTPDLIRLGTDFLDMSTAAKLVLNQVLKLNKQSQASYACRQGVNSFLITKVIKDAGFSAVRDNAMPYIDYFDINESPWIGAYGVSHSNPTNSAEQSIIDGAKAAIDSCIEFGRSISIFTHAVESTYTDASFSLASTYLAILDYIKTKRDAGLLDVMTFNEFIELSKNKF